MSTPRRYMEAAVIDGLPAFAFARYLRRHWNDVTEDLPPHVRPPLEDALEAIEHAGARWVERRRGSAEAVPAEAVRDSKMRSMEGVRPEDGRLTSAEVSTILDVSARRVRQLAEAGVLPGKQEKRGGPWTFDWGAVLAHKERNGGNK